MEMGGLSKYRQDQAPTTQLVRDTVSFSACLDVVIQKSNASSLYEQQTLAPQCAVSCCIDTVR